MRRIVIVSVLLALLLMVEDQTFAQDGANDESQNFRSEYLGVSFQYPANWIVQEEPTTQSILAGSKADITAVMAGQVPQGLLFSINVSSFGVVGVSTLEDFPTVLTRIANAPSAAPKPITIGGADGLVLDQRDMSQNVVARTVILSIGKRQVAVVRGVSTVQGWSKQAEAEFDALTKTLTFVPPQTFADAFGRVLWQVLTDKLTDLADVTVSPDGATLYVTDRVQGIWQVSATGTAGDMIKPPAIGAFGSLGSLRTGVFVADAVNNSIWVVDPSNGKAIKLVGGEVGTGKGQFGAKSPQSFAFGVTGMIYVLDQNEKGLRVQIFGRGGDWAATWELSNVLPTPIEDPVISSDDDGNIYLIGRNTAGIIKLNAGGKLIASDIGKEALVKAGARAMIVDRFGNFYVATTDQGILNIDPTGKLLGVIGDAYDESAPPKPGQLGKPVGMTLADGGKLLYVADSGKYPQVVAFALTANASLNVIAGTHDAGMITYGQTVTGEITEKTFIDVYKFEARGGDQITITMVPGVSSKIDPFLDLTEPVKDIRLVVSDDTKAKDIPPTSAQIKSYTIRYDGIYALHATRYGQETTNTTGSYRLTLTLERTVKR